MAKLPVDYAEHRQANDKAEIKFVRENRELIDKMIANDWTVSRIVAELAKVGVPIAAHDFRSALQTEEQRIAEAQRRKQRRQTKKEAAAAKPDEGAENS